MGSRVSDMASIDLPLVRAAALPTRTRNRTVIILSTIALATALAAPAALAPVGDADGIDHSNICEATAIIALEAGRREIIEDLYYAYAICLNIADEEAQAECLEEAREEYQENRQLIWDQYEARLDLCDLLPGGEPDGYDPQIDPADFQDEQGDPHPIDNELLPYLLGNTWTYEGESDESLEVIVVTVTDAGPVTTASVNESR